MSKLDPKNSETWTAQNIKEHIAEIDAKFLSPDKRAAQVLELLKDKIDSTLTVWDIVCFCAEYLAYLSTTYDLLEPGAKELNRAVYRLHYFLLDLNTENGIRVKQILDSESQQPPEATGGKQN